MHHRRVPHRGRERCGGVPVNDEEKPMADELINVPMTRKEARTVASVMDRARGAAMALGCSLPEETRELCARLETLANPRSHDSADCPAIAAALRGEYLDCECLPF